VISAAAPGDLILSIPLKVGEEIDDEVDESLPRMPTIKGGVSQQ
jgi:hypothetical protein